MLTTILIALLVVVLLIAAVGGFMFYKWVSAGNLLSALDARCDTAFADIDVHLKHRHDLIPRLVEVLKGQTNYEAEMVDSINAARTDALNAISPSIRLEAEKKLNAQVVNMLSFMEKDPALRSLPDYRHLRDEITECDERITAARRFHNLAIEEYNMALTQWPTSKVATNRRMSKRQAFDLGLDRVLMNEPTPLGL